MKKEKRNNLTLPIFLLIVLTDIGETAAEIFMKKGLNNIGIASVTFGNVLEFASRNIVSPYIWAGAAIYVVSFMVWVAILSRLDLSIAFPIGSTSYIFVPIMATIFLGEKVSLLRWAGILLIVSGIHVLSRSKQKGVL